MNIKTIANNLNQSVTTVKTACEDIFGRIPTDFNDDVVAKLKEHFNTNDSCERLASAEPTVSSSIGTSTDKKLTRTERKAKLEENRIRAMQQQGQSEAIRDFQIKRNSYEETYDFLEVEYHNRENIESARTRHRSRFIGQNASEVNQIQQAEIVDITEESFKQIEPQKIDLRMLLPAKDTTTETKPKFDLRDLL
jgi:hypothetical protein